jgi:DNA-binding protein H-NS
MLHPRVKELLDTWRELERQLETADAELREKVTAEIERIHREYVEATEIVARDSAEARSDLG